MKRGFLAVVVLGSGVSLALAQPVPRTADAPAPVAPAAAASPPIALMELRPAPELVEGAPPNLMTNPDSKQVVQGQMLPPEAPELPPPMPLPPGAGVPLDYPPPMLGFAEIKDLPCRNWVSADFLLWFTAHAPLNYPLVTGSVNPTATGAVDGAATVNYFDRSNLNFQNYSGARITVGRWIDDDELNGVEASIFGVFSPGVKFTAAATTTTPASVGTPMFPYSIFRPYVDVSTGSTSGAAVGQQITSVLSINGYVNINASSNLWGSEVNGLRSIYRSPVLEVDALAGFRYLSLTERLQIFEYSTVVNNSLLNLSNGNSFSILDRFNTFNQFMGGQIGGRASYRRENMILTVTGKLAVGDTHQMSEVNGATSFAGTTNSIVPGGFLALPSNSGSFTRDVFTFVPQIGMTLGYQFGTHCRIYGGYDFLYWTSVARPGDQINQNINPANVPSLAAAGVTGNTSASPTPLFITREFWAQGVSAGMEIRY